ncbi:MAG: hypothetical protein ACREJC_05035, partial [Tepidisphaeraceae bacterium]
SAVRCAGGGGMISAQSAITRCRRDLTLGAIVKVVLLGAAACALIVEPVLGIGLDAGIALGAVGAVWLLLGFRSMRGSRLAADSPMLIASGQYDAAERQIVGALESFTLFRGAKLMSLHQLAVLRHAQNRWQESATLCRALLAQRRGAPRGIGRSTRLILAGSLLEMGEVEPAGRNIAALYEHRLSLGESLTLLLVQLDYESRLGRWAAMTGGIMSKVGLAELMPATNAARTQALLALGALHSGRKDWFQWLRRRVELLIEPEELKAWRPVLSELWAVS